MDLVKLEKAPKMAVVSRINFLGDAVTLVLTYAEIPYDVIMIDNRRTAYVRLVAYAS